MAEFLLEVFSEEIPARMQERAANDLKSLITVGLKDMGLEFTSAKAFVTPRRLTLVVEGLPEKQFNVSEERRGPRANAPEKSVAGFKASLPKEAVIQKRETEKGTFYFAAVNLEGRETPNVLAEIIPGALDNVPWPKSMRWANYDFRWVRPIHSVIAIFNGAAISFSWAGVETGISTRGHRFLAPDAFDVLNFSDYREKLLNANVMLDANERRTHIWFEAERLAAREGFTVREDPVLLDEVTGLVEWPVVYMGSIDDGFMNVPPEVLITTMRSHQKYFSCLDANRNVANRFIMVANTETADNGKKVIDGNERVLKARLSDAKFFWDQDRKTTLISKTYSLKKRIFHAKLGTLDEKAIRVQALASEIACYVKGADKDQVRLAAQLAKADLSSEMVGEFPELQGIMGRYYALYDGHSPEVANAIAEHYSPLGPNDECPSRSISVCISLADKIDSLVGFFVIDEKPSGSKDPFALRRTALGIARILIENGIRLNLKDVFGISIDTYLSQQNSAIEEKLSNAASKFNDSVSRPFRTLFEALHVPELFGFFVDRMKVQLKERGVRYDAIDAIFALGGEFDPVRLIARVDALSEFLVSEDGENLLTAYRRATNILRIEEKKDGCQHDGAIDTGLFEQDEERALSGGLSEATSAIALAVNKEDFVGAMVALAGLYGPVDAFFDKVTVNAEDTSLRENRLKLLNGIRSALEEVADFSKIQG